LEASVAETTADGRAWIADELSYLWHLLWDSYQAHLHACWHDSGVRLWQDGGAWSARCEQIGEHIVSATGLVGPIPWQDIPLVALADGWFEWANRKLGIPDPQLPGDADLAYCREWIHQYPLSNLTAGVAIEESESLAEVAAEIARRSGPRHGPQGSPACPDAAIDAGAGESTQARQGGPGR
jgi:hypothetical protein